MCKLETRLLLRYLLPIDPYSFPVLSEQHSSQGSYWKNSRVNSVVIWVNMTLDHGIYD